MAKPAVTLRSLYVPLAMLLLAGAAASWYLLIWAPAQRNYFKNRDLRLLSIMSSQIQATVDNLDNVLDNAAGSENLDVWFADQGIEFLGPSSRHGCPPPRKGRPEEVSAECFRPEVDLALVDKAGDPPRVKIKRDQGIDYLYLYFNNGSATIVIREAIVDLVGPFIQTKRDFDAVLLVQKNGHVIFQHAEPPLQLARIDALQDSQGQPIYLEALGEFTDASDVKLAGTNYKLYAQPVQLSFPSIEPPVAPKAAEAIARQGSSKPTRQGTHPRSAAAGDEKGAASRETAEVKEKARAQAPVSAGEGEAEEWMLCGLVNSDRFKSESLAISYNYIIWFAIILLALLLTYPLVRLRFAGPKERVRARDGVLLAISSFLGAGLAAFVLLDLYYYYGEFQAHAEAQLKGFAQEINEHFAKEVTLIWAQLGDFQATNPQLSARKLPTIAMTEEHLTPQGCAGDLLSDKLHFSCKTDILDRQDPEREKEAATHCSLNGRKVQYPYFRFVFWDDREAYQRVKCSVEPLITPFLNLARAKLGYYDEVKRKYYLLSQELAPGNSKLEEDREWQAKGLGLIYSPNTGENLAAFWKLINLGQNPSPGRTQLISETLITTPVSVIQPVLPEDYEFAVVDQEGRVKFHSDLTRNLRENFFDECDRNGTLRSLVMGHGSGSLSAYYRGRSHLLYVVPLKENPDQSAWSIVAFRDKAGQETLNLELLSVASILFLLYGCLLGLVWALTNVTYFVLGKPYPARWFWPDKKRRADYRQLTLVNAALAVLLFLWIALSRGPAGVWVALVIPLLAVALGFWRLSREHGVEREAANEPQSLFRPAPGPGWQNDQLWARVSLLVVIAVLPAFALFKAAYDFEQRLFVKRGQSKLAAQIDQRRERIGKRYEKFNLECGVRNAIFSEPQDRECSDNTTAEQGLSCSLDSYHGAFFQTKLASPGGKCTAGGAEEPNGWEYVLARMRPEYNAMAVETQGVVPDRRSDAAWEWCAGDQIKFTKHQNEPNGPLVMTSNLAPLHVPWNAWWWLVLALFAFIGALYLWMRFGLARIFVLDLYHPPGLTEAAMALSSDFSAALENFPGKVSSASDRSAEELKQQLRQECAPTSELQRIGKKIVDSLPDGPQSEFRDDQLLDLVSRHARAYYASLWAVLSTGERLALVQLAEEGLVNPNNRAVVHQLMAKGLIRRDRRFGIMNESFRRFAISATPRETVKEWEEEGIKMHWGVARILLLLAVLVFLFLTQQEWLAYATGFAAAVPALLQILGLFKRSTPTQGGN